MRLVGLISGGKDSLFNMLQCIAAGHEIVAVANIEPETRGELDSYMYQSVGHEVITLVAGALCLPIFRQKTKGKAICQNKIYVKTSQDEVEDLLLLLTQVKRGINIDGVSVGAIASDYQRTRVENVCSRLGLKCFAYLWRRNQIELLQEMIDAHLDAIIVKVASIGLNTKHLGMNIRDIQPYLLDLHKQYGMNVCGEGGEYETITLDCPLFHRSITITESEKIVLSNDAFAPVGFLNVRNANLDLKSWEDGGPISLQEKTNIIKALIKGPYAYVQDCVDEVSDAIFPQRTPVTVEDLPFPFEDDKASVAEPVKYVQEYWKKASIIRPQSTIKVESSRSATTLDTSVCNLNYTSGWCCIGNVTGLTISDAMEFVQTHLQRMNYNFQDVVFVNIFVRDLSEYGRINATYSSFMPEIQPPARAFVETSLPPEVGAVLNVVAHKLLSKCQMALNVVSSEEREIMHVQSISHWAPANVGPYSQCIMISGIYYVAGQIPLIPGTMEILNKPIFHQCRLALRHVLRILQAMNEILDYSNILQAICYVTSEEIATDIGALWSYITKVNHTSVAVVVVTELPKRAQLEWEVLACGYKNPSGNEEMSVVEDFHVHLKRCFYTDPFASSLVCKIGYLKKQSNKSQTKLPGKSFKGISEVLRQCVEFLRKGSKPGGAPLCMLKLYYKTSEHPISVILQESIQSFIDSKVVATAIPVVACEDPDTFLTVTGVCS